MASNWLTLRSPTERSRGWLSSDPASTVRRAELFGAVAAPINLVIQDTGHGHTADNLTVGAAAQLAFADALHAHVADALVLTATSGLAIAGTLHDHVAESPALSAILPLVVAEALHAHFADGLAVLAAANLTVQDALHGGVAASGGGVRVNDPDERRFAYRNRDTIPPAVGSRVARRWQ